MFDSLGVGFSSLNDSGVALSLVMVDQKLDNEMVWNFRGSDGMIVSTTESSNPVGLGLFRRSMALSVCHLTLMTAGSVCRRSIFSFSVILDLNSSAKKVFFLSSCRRSDW